MHISYLSKPKYELNHPIHYTALKNPDYERRTFDINDNKE